jgi:sec-independent protein translocase protein TatB
MDNIGFTELVLLGIIALVVLGPEKLPGAIRTASLWIGRLKRSFNSIKTDIEREIGADEIRRQLRNEAIMDKFKQTKSQVNDAVSSIKKTTDEIRKSVELEARTIESATAPVTTPAPAPQLAPAAIPAGTSSAASGTTAEVAPPAAPTVPTQTEATAQPEGGNKP